MRVRRAIGVPPVPSHHPPPPEWVIRAHAVSLSRARLSPDPSPDTPRTTSWQRAARHPTSRPGPAASHPHGVPPHLPRTPPGAARAGCAAQRCRSSTGSMVDHPPPTRPRAPSPAHLCGAVQCTWRPRWGSWRRLTQRPPPRPPNASARARGAPAFPPPVGARARALRGARRYPKGGPRRRLHRPVLHAAPRGVVWVPRRRHRRRPSAWEALPPLGWDGAGT